MTMSVPPRTAEVERLTQQNRRLRAALAGVGVAVLIVTCWSAVSVAQTSPATISIGGETFSIGMPRAEAEAKLNSCCRLGDTTTFGAPENSAREGFIFFSKAGPPYKQLGAVSFANGRVSHIVKTLTDSYADESVALAQSFYRALAGASGDRVGAAAGAGGGTVDTVVLTTGIDDTTQVMLKTIQIDFPANGRTIVMHIQLPDSQMQKPTLQDSVTILEGLGNIKSSVR